jgi:hypothetical protein
MENGELVQYRKGIKGKRLEYPANKYRYPRLGTEVKPANVRLIGTWPYLP